jgi:hypothetical protein
MNLDTPLRKVAQTVLTKFGTAVTIRRVAGTYDVATGISTPSNSDTTVKGRLGNYTDRELSNTVHAGDRKLEIAAADLAFQPSVDDEVLIAGVSYDIVNVKPTLATDLPALYVLQLRR